MLRNYICKARNLCDSEESASCLSRKSFSSGHIVTTSNLSQSSGSWPHPSADKDKKQVSCKSRPKRLILSSRKSQTAVENCNVCGITEIACIAGGNRSGDTHSESAVRVKTNSDESVNIKDTFSLHKFKFHIMQRYGETEVLLHAHLTLAVYCAKLETLCFDHFTS
jgi:hypothetical protein